MLYARQSNPQTPVEVFIIKNVWREILSAPSMGPCTAKFAQVFVTQKEKNENTTSAEVL